MMHVSEMFEQHAQRLQIDDTVISVSNLSEWKAPWLHSKFTSSVWEIGHDLTPIYFNDYLVNGERLSDSKYKGVVNTIKKIIFLKRSGPYATMTRTTQQYDLARSLKAILAYLIKSGEDVESDNFCCLSLFLATHYTKTAIAGSVDAVVGKADLLITTLQELSDAGELATVLTAKGVLSNQKLGKHLGLPTTYVGNTSAITRSKMSVFAELPKCKSGYKTEFTNQAPPKRGSDDEDMSPSSIYGLTTGFNAINEVAHCLPELENYQRFKFKVKDLFGADVKEDKRTANIPINVGLAYLNSAIGFILNYGESIVATKVNCDQQLKDLQSKGTARRDHYVKQVKIPSNKFTKDFKVERFNLLPESRPELFRDNVTVEFACEMLEAAAYLTIGTFACKRIEEVLGLTEASCRPAPWGGYEMVFGIEKASPEERLTLTGRPIPKFVDTVFGYISEINESVVEDGTAIERFLFQKELTLDTQGCMRSNVGASDDSIKMKLDKFADFFEIPITTIIGVQYRWYLSTHQLRRFFAMSYYNYNEYKHLNALTWLMGHKSSEETMRYISEELGNEEMAEEQARAVADTLYDRENGKDESIFDLAKTIEAKFECKLDLIKKNEVEEYIAEKLNSGSTLVINTESKSNQMIFMEVNHD